MRELPVRSAIAAGGAAARRALEWELCLAVGSEDSVGRDGAPSEGVDAASAVRGDGIGVADVGEAEVGARYVVARGHRQLAADPMCGGHGSSD
jgi:hypothetical protein